ncbi:MAG: methyltransferase domain-containing protein [Dehalococcoidia bacterium]|jgi:glycosyltransferase involved in cell wall biosynthesis/tetratricopeptide (TPR) repeat protein|nr:methyltransferase domain-containing protein [Dehalococcoidia bacterium]
MRFVTLVECDQDIAALLETAKSSWDRFGEVLNVFRDDEGKLAERLNARVAHIEGPAWVALAELNEEFAGDGENVKEELGFYVERLYRENVQLTAAASWVGQDYATAKAYRPKIWFVPEGSTFGAEWEFRFEVDVVVTSRRPTADNAMFSVTKENFAISRRTSIRSIGEVDRRQAIVAALGHELTCAEEQHYQAALVPPWSPLLSLCVIARGVDEALLRMLESVRGHVSEVCILFTTFEDPGVDLSTADGCLHDTVDVPLRIDCWHDPHSFQQSDGTWCIANFDWARQQCFGLASGMFRMFLDADDTLEWTGAPPAPPLWDIVAKNFLAGAKRAYSSRSVALPYFYVGSELKDAAVPGIAQPRSCIFLWGEDGHPLWRWHRPLHERAVPTEWNVVSRHDSVELPGEIFIIRHHGDADVGSHQERNRYIAEWALEYRPDLSDMDRAALEFVLATIALREDGIAAAAPRFERAMELGQGDSYGLVAAIDYATALIAAHRPKDALEIVMPRLDLFPTDQGLMLVAARAYRKMQQPGLALKWYWKALAEKPETPAGQSYRCLVADVEYAARLEAVDAAVEVRQLDAAVTILEKAPASIKKRPEVERAVTNVRRLAGDNIAATSVLALVHYLLSLDCVDLAAQVVDSLTPQLLELEPVVRARRAVERRSRHLRDDGAYLATYDILNEADLVVKAKRHQGFLLERIIAAGPVEFWDVGCNTAWLTIAVAQALPKCHCVGIDISTARVEEAQRRAKLAGVENVEFFVDGAVPERPDTCSKIFVDTFGPRLVLISEVLEHLISPIDVLNFWQYEGGADRIMITVPDVEAYYNLWWWARQLNEPLSHSQRLGSEGAEHVRCYDAHRIVAELREAGFEPERVERVDISQNLVGEGEPDQSLLFVDAVRGASMEAMAALHPFGRIDIFCEGYVPWGPRAHLEGSGATSRMVGGSEQAVIHLAPELAARGYEVHVYAAPMERRGFERGVWWHHLGEFVPSEPRDLVIVWRRAEHLHRCVTEAEGRWPVWLWCHDVPDPKRAANYRVADRVLVLSQYQRELYAAVGVAQGKLVVLQNGVDAAAIEVARTTRDPAVVTAREFDSRAVFYGSSGDRGLLHLLRMWPSVREAVPDAQLICTYRTDLMRWPTNPPIWFKIADEIERLGRELPGVTFYPGLPHDEYLAAASRCGVWAYPSNFEEISCIVAMEMQALGLEPVATDLAALSETVLEGPLVRWNIVSDELIAGGARSEGGTLWVPDGCFSKTFRDVLVGALLDPMSGNDRLKLSEDALARYSWTVTARLFAEAIEESRHGDHPHEEPRE